MTEKGPPPKLTGSNYPTVNTKDSTEEGPLGNGDQGQGDYITYVKSFIHTHTHTHE